MATAEFISIRDAADLASVSKKTIERAYKKHLAEKGLTVETASDIIRVEVQGGRKRCFISDAFVRRIIMKPASNRDTRSSTRMDDELVKQLQMKDEQIRTAGDHIAQLTERLKGAQEALGREQALHLRTQDSKRPLLAMPMRHRHKEQNATEVHSSSSSTGFVNLQWGRMGLAVLAVMSMTVFSLGLWLSSL